jgi:hypothetical protein
MRNLFKSINLAFLLVIILLASCKKDVDGNIRINFINVTGKDLSGVTVNDKVIGTLKENGETGYICFDSFGTDTGWPDAKVTAVAGGTELECTSQFYWCGTEKDELSSGKYNIYISIANVGGVDYLNLRFR